MPNDLFAKLEKYSETATFDQNTIPPALQRDHSTKANVWRRIVVSKGTLIYLRADRPAQIVTPADPATIFPQELHSVQSKGDVQFKVEFYREKPKGEAA